MTFTELVDAAAERLNIVGAEGLARIGRSINIYYKRVTSSLGIATARRTTVQATVTLGVDLLVFDGITKIDHVEDRTTTPATLLEEVSSTEIAEGAQGDTATRYCVYSTTAHSITIRMDAIPQTQFVLYADALDRADTLSGTDEPAFSEDYHDLLVCAAIYEERLKMEKGQLAMIAKAEYEDRLGDLRLFIAKSAQQDIYQGKRSEAGTGSSSGSGSGVNGAFSYTQTGLITFDRDPLAPFAVSASSAVVPNLDADKLDGLDWTTAANVTSAAHGMAPIAPADATKFLNGAATPAYAQVNGSDLALTDVTTNNVTSTKHGFAPKSGADATTFLNGAATPAYAAVKDSDQAFTDITTNNASTTKHGFMPKLGNNANRYFDGTGAQSQVSLAAAVTGVLPTANGGTSVDIASAALPLASGQITFPATQNPSTGVNVLDDYEEGTWTPSLGGNTTYTSQLGDYIKVGRKVWVSGLVQVNAIGTGSVSTISGLPFALSTRSGMAATAVSVGFWGTAASAFAFLGGLVIGSTIVFTGVTAGNASHTNPATVFTGSTLVYFSATYETSA